jgi:hypothetical protein
VSLAVDLQGVEDSTFKTIETQGLQYFQHNKKPMSFYRHDGKLKYINVADLCTKIIKRERMFEVELGQEFVIDLSNRNIFGRSKDDKYIKLLSVKVICLQVARHLPRLRPTVGPQPPFEIKLNG